MTKYFYSLALLLTLLQSQYCKAQTVTWADDIACIAYSHCASCHNNQNSLVAFPLTSYDEVFAQRNAVKYYTGYLSMPPYQPNTKHRNFAMQKTLTQQEIDLIAAWVDGGCLKGDTANEPPPPIINSPKSAIKSPDFSVKIPDYVIPNNGVNFRRCFILSAPLNSDKLIKEIEIIPGNLSAIYAVYVFADTSSIPVSLDAVDSGYGYTNFGGTGSNSAKPLYGWVHTQGPLVLPGNFALQIESGSRFILQIEYAEDAGGKLDSTRLNIKYAPPANRSVMINPLLHHAINLMNGPFIIPPDTKKEFHEQKTMTADFTVFSISPLLHHICTDFEVYAVQPNNDTLRIMEVDDHGEIWSEGTYYFQKPIFLKSGTILHAFANFDNTLSNGRNPNNPPLAISAGFSELDEQMIFNFAYAPYLSGDENIILDSISHLAHYQGCSPLHIASGISALLSIDNKFVMYPNPATQNVNIEVKGALPFVEINILNILGETILKQNVSTKTNISMDVSLLSNGVYFLNLKSENESKTIKLIKQ